MPKDLTMDTWLAEIEKLQRRTVDGVTAREIMDATGKGEKTVLNAIRVGIANGRCVYIGRKPITRVDGTTNQSPAYRFIGRAKK
jgi:hypothetical protein